MVAQWIAHHAVSGFIALPYRQLTTNKWWINGGRSGLGTRRLWFDFHFGHHFVFHSFQIWIPALHKGGPPIELPSLRGMRVLAESLLMAHPGIRWVKRSLTKRWVINSVGQFLHTPDICQSTEENLHLHERPCLPNPTSKFLHRLQYALLLKCFSLHTWVPSSWTFCQGISNNWSQYHSFKHCKCLIYSVT